MSTDIAERPAIRRVIHRTRGRGHGPIVRLMSPSDLGEELKPFVFLDLFDFDARSLGDMPLHPHSGIATVTVLAEGEFLFSDPASGKGTIRPGGVEWMRAGGGVWHGKEMSPGAEPRIKGFQLWLALPPELENSAVDSQYIKASDIPTVGPARVVLGSHGGVTSPVRSPAGLNYLLVTLAPGERWSYVLPNDQGQLWIATATGSLDIDGDRADSGEMALLDGRDGEVAFTGGVAGATFVLGSAVPHPHDLVLGYYSVHTTPDALAQGEARINELARRMQEDGIGQTDGAVSVYAG